MNKAFALVITMFFAFKTIVAQKNMEINNGITRPKLVVGIVVDQMRWDYIYRYYNRYSAGGFKRFLQKGFTCENTHIPYTPTVTAAGHTCVYTGSVPAIHGIVGNDWVERETNTNLYCTQDKTVQTIGSTSAQGQMSPRNMFANTIGDELRLATNFKSRVYGIALKDRGAILPAGHTANGAYWFDDLTGNWITSSYYMTALPTWVNNFNAEKRPEEFAKTGWNLLYDISKYDQSTADDNVFEKKMNGQTTVTFPHTFTTKNGTDYNSIRYSAFGNTFTLDFAKKMIQAEKLGKTGQTDMLCVSLSSTDYVGHLYGPQSLEAEDMYIRLDKDIAEFFAMLDVFFEENEYTVFLTADHGAPYTPDYAKSVKLAAGNISYNKLKADVDNALFDKYKVKNILQRYTEFQYYLNKKVIDSAKLSVKEVEDFVTTTLLKKPEVMYAFSYSNFANAIMPDVFRKNFTNGYFSKRSGDIQIVLKPQYTDGNGLGTDHGVGYNYDTHIPMLWYGANVKQGKLLRETYMTDIAPTLAAMLHIQAPNGSVGKVIEEVVR
jgi:predicted AlkP superfamily pyrophosphatase or phosphodiesterase